MVLAIFREPCAGLITCRASVSPAIWLMPFQPYQGKDDGYDIADYYGVDPRFGTLGDFVEFTKGCRQRGLVHDQPGSQPHLGPASLVSGSAPRPQVKVSRLVCVVEEETKERRLRDSIFPGVQKSTATHDDVAKAYYFHRYYDFQPDLNTANPEVQAEILEIIALVPACIPVFVWTLFPLSLILRRKPRVTSRSAKCCAPSSQFLTWRKGDAIHLGGGRCPARHRYTLLWSSRRTVADDVQFHRQSTSFLATATRRPLDQSAMQTTSRLRRPTVGAASSRSRRTRPRPS